MATGERCPACHRRDCGDGAALSRYWSAGDAGARKRLLDAWLAAYEQCRGRAVDGPARSIAAERRVEALVRGHQQQSLLVDLADKARVAAEERVAQADVLLREVLKPAALPDLELWRKINAWLDGPGKEKT